MMLANNRGYILAALMMRCRLWANFGGNQASEASGSSSQPSSSLNVWPSDNGPVTLHRKSKGRAEHNRYLKSIFPLILPGTTARSPAQRQAPLRRRWTIASVGVALYCPALPSQFPLFSLSTFVVSTHFSQSPQDFLCMKTWRPKTATPSQTSRWLSRRPKSTP